MLRSMCNNFRKWKSSYRVFIVFLSVLVFTFIREDYLRQYAQDVGLAVTPYFFAFQMAILCSICPVKLSKAGLHYNTETNNIEDRIRDWLVEMPDWGFLFPQFNDRSTDIHGLLYYTKNAENLRSTMMEEVFGCTTPLSAGTQRDSFNALVEETLGDDCAYDTVLEIHEKLNDLIESQKDEPEPVVLTKSEVKRLFEECGVEDEKLQNFDEQYELAAGEKSALVASNITNTRKFEIKTPDVVIHVAPDRAELVETRIIDGRKCLVIPMESEIELNGIRVSALNSVEDTSAEPLPVNRNSGRCRRKQKYQERISLHHSSAHRSGQP